MLTWINRLCCGLQGHDNLMRFAKDRVYLQCLSCGHESPGWALSDSGSKVVATNGARRHSSVTPHLVSERRVA